VKYFHLENDAVLERGGIGMRRLEESVTHNSDIELKLSHFISCFYNAGLET